MKPRVGSPGLAALTVVVVVMAVGLALPALAPWRQGVVVAAALTYLAVALTSHRLPAGSARSRVALGVELLLGVVIVVVSDGIASLAITPLLSVLVITESVAAGTTVGVGFVALIGLLEHRLGYGARELVERMVANAAAVLFVVAFARLARDETRARAESERLSATLKDAHDRLRTYASRVEDVATEKERNRIAREIHDGLGHSLTIIAVQLEAARMLLPKDPERARGHVERAHAVTRKGLDDVRASVAMLREPGEPVSSIGETLASLVEETRASGVAASFDLVGEERPVSAPVRAMLFRTGQEGLTNVRRHAPDATARLELRYGASDVVLAIEDDGPGAIDVEGGFGLVGIRERALALGATVEIRTAPGQGLRLVVQVPG
jgi:signal transduction histidine kinase